MVRIVKEYDDRYAEFLNVAQELFFSQGYDLTSVQDIIRNVGVAKGTFYHYFTSKTEILEAVVKRSYQGTLTSLEPLMSDSTLNAIEKLEQFFVQIHNWKVAHRDFLIETIRVLYLDENVLLRNKMRDKSMQTVAPLIAQIIQQGVNEGVFEIDYPLETAELILKMSESLSEASASLLLANGYDGHVIEHIKRKIRVYNLSVGRILDVSTGSLKLIDEDVLNDWLSDDE